MNKTILLISPPTIPGREMLLSPSLATNLSYLPISLLYLASTLSTRFDVQILDYATMRLWQFEPNQAHQLVEKKLKSTLDEICPFLVGISCQFSTHVHSTIKTASLVKKLCPSTKVVLGGLPPTLFGNDMLRECPDIDFVIKGEGDISSLDLAVALSSDSDVSHIDGLIWRDADGMIRGNPKTKFIENLDELPRPRYDLFDFAKYNMKQITAPWHNPKQLPIEMPMPILTSRSCPHHCNFCCRFHTMGPRMRAHSADYVLNEMEWLYHERGISYFTFLDDNFTYSKERVMQICQGILDRRLDIQFRSFAGLSMNSLDSEVIEALSAAGLIWASVAIESGSEFIRNKVIGKNLSLPKILKMVEELAKYPHMMRTAMFIIGMPEETPESLTDTYNLIEALDLDNCSLANAAPYPGTALYNQCVRDGLLLCEAGNWREEGVFNSSRSSPRFFIQPYNMSVDALAEHRLKLDELISRKRSTRYRDVSRDAYKVGIME